MNLNIELEDDIVYVSNTSTDESYQELRKTIEPSINLLLTDSGEQAINKDSIDLLADCGIRFMRDLIGETAYIQHSSNAPLINAQFIKHLVRSNRPMTQMTDTILRNLECNPNDPFSYLAQQEKHLIQQARKKKPKLIVSSADRRQRQQQQQQQQQQRQPAQSSAAISTPAKPTASSAAAGTVTTTPAVSTDIATTQSNGDQPQDAKVTGGVMDDDNTPSSTKAEHPSTSTSTPVDSTPIKQDTSGEATVPTPQQQQQPQGHSQTNAPDVKDSTTASSLTTGAPEAIKTEEPMAGDGPSTSAPAPATATKEETTSTELVPTQSPLQDIQGQTTQQQDVKPDTSGASAEPSSAPGATTTASSTVESDQQPKKRVLSLKFRRKSANTDAKTAQQQQPPPAAAAVPTAPTSHIPGVPMASALPQGQHPATQGSVPAVQDPTQYLQHTQATPGNPLAQQQPQYHQQVPPHGYHPPHGQFPQGFPPGMVPPPAAAAAMAMQFPQQQYHQMQQPTAAHIQQQLPQQMYAHGMAAVPGMNPGYPPYNTAYPQPPHPQQQPPHPGYPHPNNYQGRPPYG